MKSNWNIPNWVLEKLQTHTKHFKNKLLLDWELNYKPKLSEFEDIHKGGSCFIIGNGPSLNKMDLSLLRNYTCFGLNKIHMHPDIHNFGVDYHVAVNPLVIRQSFDDFKTLNCPSFLSYRASLRNDIKNSSYNIIFTDETHVFSPNPYAPIEEGCTVTFVAMQLAYFMGFTNVYLIGVDHNFMIKGKPHEKQTLHGLDQNHFHPNYFGGHQWNLPDLEGSETAYQLALNYYRQGQRCIFDATLGGKLDIFPKIEFEKAIEQCAQNAVT